MCTCISNKHLFQMGNDYYPCAGGCEKVVCDAADYERCDICRGWWHPECWKEDGTELCQLCPCMCSGAHDPNMSERAQPGSPSDYDRENFVKEQSGCEGCDCESHECVTMRCCTNCRSKLMDEPSENAQKNAMIQNIPVAELAQRLGLDLQQIIVDLNKKRKLPKVMPYISRTCDHCKSDMKFSDVGDSCPECEKYVCTKCWTKEDKCCAKCTLTQEPSPKRRCAMLDWKPSYQHAQKCPGCDQYMQGSEEVESKGSWTFHSACADFVYDKDEQPTTLPPPVNLAIFKEHTQSDLCEFKNFNMCSGCQRMHYLNCIGACPGCWKREV